MFMRSEVLRKYKRCKIYIGDKLRLVVTANRRVKIVGQLIEELEEEVPEKGKKVPLFSPCASMTQ